MDDGTIHPVAAVGTINHFFAFFKPEGINNWLNIWRLSKEMRIFVPSRCRKRLLTDILKESAFRLF